MQETRFWKKAWDEGVDDLDPSEFETTFLHETRGIFEKFPDKVALEFLGVEITFRELDVLSNRFANFLRDAGLRKGDRVGIGLPNAPQFAVALLGVLKAGCVVSGVSPLLSDVQMHYQLEDLGARGFVTLDAIFEQRLSKVAGRLPDLDVVVVTNVADFLPGIKRVLGKLLGKVPKGKVFPLEGKQVVQFRDLVKPGAHSDALPPLEATPDDLAYVLYTGGTTGPPKGAMIAHRNSVADLKIVKRWLNWEEGKGIACSGFPFFHIAGMFFCLSCLFLGWTQLLVPNPRDTDHICKLIAKYRPSILVNVPSLFQMLLKNPKFAQLDHSSLEVCISAASPFPEESQRELEAVVGPGKLMEVYGMTETSPLTVMNPFEGKRKLGHIGLPIPNVDVKLVNPDDGSEVPVGQPGEICVRGPMVMKGYWNKPEETAKAIDADGFMHTGDVGAFDDEGYLKIVDRTKDMIIVSGFKVFSSKLEDVLVKHPHVDQAAVVGVPNPQRPGSELVKAYLAPPPDFPEEKLDQLGDEVVEWVRDKVAPYEVPKLVEVRREMPLTVVGKVDKKVLREEAKKK
ncbi:MAG: long-chain fatty acid--CoA ligase [Promethearchaeota archaeon]